MVIISTPAIAMPLIAIPVMAKAVMVIAEISMAISDPADQSPQSISTSANQCPLPINALNQCPQLISCICQSVPSANELPG